MMEICFSMGRGSYWGCFKISTSRMPRLSCCWVALSSSEPNWAKAASDRCGDVGRDGALRGLDDGERGERTAAQGIIQLGGPLQQAGVVIENISGIGFPAR